MSTSRTVSSEAPQYEEFYDFRQSPFTLAPDPRFLYRSPSHEDAINALLRAIAHGKGVAVLSGDIGTGKTTVCRTVLERLGPTWFSALVLNPFLSLEELLREVLLDFGVLSRDAVRRGDLTGVSRQALLRALHTFLDSLASLGARAVVVIDEAQHVGPGVVDELTALASPHTGQAPLLQLVLVGQLGLLDRLRASEQHAPDRAVWLRAVLQPLTRTQVEAYIEHRLALAVGPTPVAFDRRALDLVHESTAGVPRLINRLCDRALLVGAGLGLHTITRDTVATAARSVGLDARSPLRAWWSRVPGWVRIVAAGVLLVGFILVWT